MTVNDERAAEGIEHLQSAALELIEAARAFLDVAEDVVHDRSKVEDVMAAASTIADAVGLDDRRFGRRSPTRPARGTAAGRAARGGAAGGAPGGAAGASSRRSARPTSVEHIDVS